MMSSTERIKTRSIGGAIPEDLYWKFKEAQAARRESTVKALEIAIRLYLDAAFEKKQTVLVRNLSEEEIYEQR